MSPSTDPGPATDEGEGAQIGRYELREQIGEGGFGTVWMAEQKEPVRRQVALKIIKLGMDSKQVIARFEVERQALAMMDHPNIAKVLDAGTTQRGRPYFVMELVRGKSITTYCNEHNLSVTERLELFQEVCGAVQHAHQKGIIHRDLKPSNVMITLNDGKPAPKVIDFGVAKATGQRLTDRTLFTEMRQVIGTPLYMSPEQADTGGLDIDTRTDIYSLGVVLYELLTGVTPFTAEELLAAGYDELQRVIRQETPSKPSTRLSTLAGLPSVAAQRRMEPRRLCQLVRGDLDWIVLKALEKDRARRYESASGFAADIGRFLRDEPVVASPPSFAYLARKFVRRNRVGVLAGVLVGASLIAGVSGTTWGMLRAQEEAERAQREAAKAHEVGDYLEDMLAAAGPSVALGRDTGLLKDLVAEAARRVDERADQEPEVEAAVRAVLGMTLIELVELEEAERHLERSLEIRRELYAGVDHDELGQSLYNLGALRTRQLRHEEALELMQEALAMRERLNGREHADTATTLNRLGVVLNELGRRDEAEATLRESIAISTALGNRETAASAEGNLAAVFDATGRGAESIAVQRRALATLEEVHAGPHPSQARILANLAIDLHSVGDYAGCLEASERSLAMRRELFGEDDPSIGSSLGTLAYIPLDRGDTEQARAYLEEALAIFDKAYAGDHPDKAWVLGGLGASYYGEGRLAEAESLMRRQLEMAQRLDGTSWETASGLHNLASVNHHLGRFDEAERLFQEALVAKKNLFGEDSIEYIATLDAYTMVPQDRGELELALELASEVVDRRRELQGPDHHHVGRALRNLGLTHVSRKDFVSAEQAFREMVRIYEQAIGRDEPSTLSISRHLVTALMGQGRYPEALDFALELYERAATAHGEGGPEATRAGGKVAALYEEWNAKEPASERASEARSWRERFPKSESSFSGGD